MEDRRQIRRGKIVKDRRALADCVHLRYSPSLTKRFSGCVSRAAER